MSIHSYLKVSSNLLSRFSVYVQQQSSGFIPVGFSPCHASVAWSASSQPLRLGLLARCYPSSCVFVRDPSHSSTSATASASPCPVDGGPSTRKTDTATPRASRSEHGSIPMYSQYLVSKQYYRRAYLNMSGTMKYRTWLPLMYTCSRCETRPSRAVTVISFSWTFMLSSAVTC